jgi:hypothetical protein
MQYQDIVVEEEFKIGPRTGQQQQQICPQTGESARVSRDVLVIDKRNVQGYQMYNASRYNYSNFSLPVFQMKFKKTKFWFL